MSWAAENDGAFAATSQQVSSAWERFTGRVEHVVDFLPVLLVALGIFVAFVLLAKLVTRFEAPFKMFAKSRLARTTLQHFTFASLVVIGALVALDLLDATKVVGTILGAAGVAGLAVGFAFKNIVENYLASILLAIRRPFAARDEVRVGEHVGTVVSLTSRSTVLMTFEGNHLRLPNALVFKSVIENFSRNPRRRFDFEVGAGTSEDLTAAQRLGVTTLRETAGVMSDPKPFSRVEALGDSTVSLQFFGWVDQRQHDFFATRSEAIRRVKVAFDDAEIEMPEPMYRVAVTQSPALDSSRRSTGTLDETAHDLRPNRDVDLQIDEVGDAINESENLLRAD